MSCIGVPPNGVAMMLLANEYLFIYIYICETRNRYEYIEYYYYKDAQNDDHTRTHKAIESNK